MASSGKIHVKVGYSWIVSLLFTCALLLLTATPAGAQAGYFFEKTVADLTSGVNPATTAAPGDRLRYTLRIHTTYKALSNFTVSDELDALNAQADFAPATLALRTHPAGADISATSSTGGSKGTGVIDIRNLNLPVNSQALIQFDITLQAGLANSTVVINQATLRLADGTVLAWSDDPNVNGTADPTVPGGEDPTRVTILSPPAFVVQKVSTHLRDPKVLLDGDTLRYTIAVKNISHADAVNVVLRDAVPANTTYVAGSTTLNGAAVSDVAGVSPLVNGMRINSPANSTPGFLPADVSAKPAFSCWMVDGIPYCRLTPADPSSNGQTNVATITFDVVVDSNTVSGTVISNQGFVSATGIADQPSDDPRTRAPNDPTRDTVAGPVLVVAKSGPETMNLGQWGNFDVDVQNTGSSDAWNVYVRDLLPHGASGGMCNLIPQILSARVFAADGVTPVAGKGPLDQGSDYALGYSAEPNCQLDIRILTAAGTIGPNQRLIIRYRTQLDANTQNGVVLTNVAGAIQWFNSDISIPRRTYSNHTLTNGTPGILDYQDAFTVRVALTGYEFDKTVANLTSGANPATTAGPGDKLRYTLLFRTTTQALSNFNIVDDMDALNTQAAFASGTLTLVTTPAGANISATSSTGGSKGTGVIDIRNLSLPANGVAVIQFDITLKPAIPSGTVVSNQAAVRLANGTTFASSDDPNVNGIADPTVPNGEDPTRVTIVSASAREQRLYAQKHVALFTDLSSPNIVDPGDVLRYTITIKNSGAISATGVSLKDLVPANTTYVANSTLLNGLPVGQPDGGAAPLSTGISISSSSLTPPLPGPGAGTISPGATAVLQYDLRVNLGTPAGTVISNQAVVSSAGQPNLLTDSSGNPTNAPQPTIVVVGAGQQVSITNQVSVVGGGAAVPGAQVEYVVNVVNSGALPAYNVVITDNLNGSQPGQLTYVNASATLSSSANGLAAGVSFAGSTITANYGAVNGPLAPGGVVLLRFRATLNSRLALATVVTNTAVAAWDNPTQTTNASVSIAIGSIPGGPRTPALAVLNGSAWYDANFDNVQDSRERALSGWAVELYRDNQLSQSVQTDANGVYRISVEPNDTTGVRYELRFRGPGAGAHTAILGRAASPFTNGPQRISDIVVPSGANLEGLNLPIHPNGVIYDSLARLPVAGATLTMLAARGTSPLPANCFDDAAQQGQITLADGYYKFDINFSDPACPSGGDYLIGVTAPLGTSYVSGYSQVIPPASNASTAAFSVPACTGSAADAIPGTTRFCEAQSSEFAPAASVLPRTAGTTYYVHLMLDGSQIPGSSQIFNNHIPLDPQLLGSITITKTTPLRNVSRGQLVPYTITANNHSGLMVTDVTIVDRLPAGFSYIKGSAVLDGVPTEPSVAGLTLSWSGLTIAGTQMRTVKLLLAVGAGATGGEFVNRAQALNVATGIAMSGEAIATVRLMPDPTFDCTDVAGKVFNDANRNGRQDDGEEGLSGVRVVTPQGLEATTDQYGRYHISCAIVPNNSRGSNFVLKLDDRTLPSGFRMSTDQVRIQRATSGKALQLNFGASIHRVVAIDLLDAAFEPGRTEIGPLWRPRLSVLLDELRKAPAVVRLSYVADTEDAALVKRRVAAVKRQLTEAWGAADSSYVLTIEPEVFWRRGAPPKQPDVRVPVTR